VEASEIGPSGGLRMGYCKPSRAPLLAKTAKTKILVILYGERTSITIVQGKTQLRHTQVKFASIEIYLCESITHEPNARLVRKTFAHNSMPSLDCSFWISYGVRVLPYASCCGYLRYH
jgi:hypothetical protein